MSERTVDKAMVFLDLDREIANTRRMLEQLPEEHFSWQPHQKSWTLAALAAHTAKIMFWETTVLETDEFDLASVPRDRDEPTSLAEVLESFDDSVSRFRKAFEATSNEDLLQEWSLKHGEQTVLSDSRVAIIRNTGINHMIHHRAQLGVYLRLLDLPVPASYGPTADEQVPTGEE